MAKFIYVINGLLLFLIVLYEHNSSSDKTIFISSFGFVILLGMNLLVGLFAQMDNKPVYRHYYYSALGLFVSVAILLWIW